jgi:hypothetical protein
LFRKVSPVLKRPGRRAALRHCARIRKAGFRALLRQSERHGAKRLRQSWRVDIALGEWVIRRPAIPSLRQRAAPAQQWGEIADVIAATGVVAGETLKQALARK